MNLAVVYSTLFLAVIIDGKRFPKCSNTVPLNKNIFGTVAFKPGDIVLPGTNMTVLCVGTEGKAPIMLRQADYEIARIDIFGPDGGHLRRCTVDFNKLQACHYIINGVKDLGNFQYSCAFVARNNAFSCIAKKNLSVVENVCQAKPCDKNAICKNTATSFECKCKQGFNGDGKNCTAKRGCNSTPSPCHENAICENTINSFQCKCVPGFTGDGKICTELRQCGVNSDCNTKDDPVNCLLLNQTVRCKCNGNLIGNGTHCMEPVNNFPNALSSEGNTTKVIIAVVVPTFVLLAGLLITYWLYRKRRNARREEVFNSPIHELNKARKASKDNMDILFPEHPKDVDSSPRRRLPSIHEHNSKEEKEEEEIMSYICVLDDWEIKKDDLTILNKKLGGGCFGVVKKGLYKKKENDREFVAVKMLKDAPSAADRSDLLMELFILKEVNKTPHENVIKLIGAYTSAEPILVLTEFCSRGNLRYLLKNSRVSVTDDNNEDISQYKNVFSTLSHRKLLQIAVDIACGMKHLAASQFVHRDLAARNILISANYEAKVSDFGLARPITGVEQMYVKSNRNLLPVKWMAVESLTQGIFRTSSDVWAYGIVLWEITTLGKEPYPDISPFDTFTFVTSGNRMERPPQCSEELYGIMRKCWEHDQKDRPSFEEVHEEVKEMLDETDDRMYINVVEMDEESRKELTVLEDRRISVESMKDLRYTEG